MKKSEISWNSDGILDIPSCGYPPVSSNMARHGKLGNLRTSLAMNVFLEFAGRSTMDFQRHHSDYGNINYIGRSTMVR
jgi:hypothetical protein